MPDCNMEVEVNRIIYVNSENGFNIFSGSSLDGQHPSFVAKGYLGEIPEKTRLSITGKWVKHPKYGQQIQVENFEFLEFDQDSIKEFLASGFITGIGPSIADRVVEHFGDDTEYIFSEEPDRLTEVKGIGNQTVKKIKAAWQKYYGDRKSLVQLQKWCIGPSTIQKILKTWDNAEMAVEAISKNPYMLTILHGVGFQMADSIAKKVGINDLDFERLKAAIIFQLDEALSKQGHCFVPEKKLIDETYKLIFSDEQSTPAEKSKKLLNNAISILIGDQLLVRERENVFLDKVHRAETVAAKNMMRVLNHKCDSQIFDFQNLILEFEANNNLAFDEIQQEAIKSSLENKISIITGGPGTGKTTILDAILQIASQTKIIGYPALVAPTGRAAKKMEENTGIPAKTIHRLLEFNPQVGFRKDKKNPLEQDAIICDESSMLDIFLFRALLSAIKSDARIIFIGDIHQLPSVGGGNVLNDLIKSQTIPFIKLEKIYRQDEGSWIARNAHAVNSGNLKAMNMITANDFFWKSMMGENSNEISTRTKKYIDNLVQNLLDQGESANNIQILSPTYKTPAGVLELNNLLQKRLNLSIAENKEIVKFRYGKTEYWVGDRVMQLKNNYEKEVYNGDQAYIVEYSKAGQLATLFFPGKSANMDDCYITYGLSEFEELTLSYATTIHKAQGSEFPIIIMPVVCSQFMMLQRNLLYTAITRAKRTCYLVGEKKALSIAVKNDKPIQRNTTLKERLRELKQTSLL